MGQGKRLCCNCSSGTGDGTSKALGCGWSDHQEEKSAFEATGIEQLISPGLDLCGLRLPMRDFVMDLRKSRFELWFTGVGLILSLIAVFFSWRADKIAREANELAQQSIEVSRESNRISLLDEADPQVQPILGAIPIFVYGCKYPDSDLYHVYSLVDTNVEFFNNGGHEALLERVEIRGTPYSWTVDSTNEEFITLGFPASILPGTRRDWHFIGISSDSSQIEDEINNAFWERRISSPVLEWAFYFEDTKVVVLKTQAYGSAQDLDFSRNCEDFDNWSR